MLSHNLLFSSTIGGIIICLTDPKTAWWLLGNISVAISLLKRFTSSFSMSHLVVFTNCLSWIFGIKLSLSWILLLSVWRASLLASRSVFSLFPPSFLSLKSPELTWSFDGLVSLFLSSDYDYLFRSLYTLLSIPYSSLLLTFLSSVVFFTACV